jgi:glycosyltransferase involved in cell wall biosynthesis
VGRIDDNKRIDWIIHAIHQLRQSGYSVKHKHAGDGIRLNEMKQLVRSLGIEEHIEFLGRVNDIPRLLQKSDLFIHAAYSEGSPNVLMEAGAHGLPVVSSDCGDAPVVIPNGKAGYITPVHDRDAWYKRIEELAADPEKRVRLGNTAYHHVRDRFSVDTLRRDLISLFQTYNIQLPCAE